jgi:hypothetical protein
VSAIEIVREYFPDADDATAGAILWARTGWPTFWCGDPETWMRKQLKEAREDMLRVTATGKKWSIETL